MSCKEASYVSGGPKQCQYGCMGYGDCLRACEYGAISIENGIAVVDREKCVACGKCVKACPKEAVKVNDFLAKIDYDVCVNCGLCASKCPKKIIQ